MSAADDTMEIDDSLYRSVFSCRMKICCVYLLNLDYFRRNEHGFIIRDSETHD